MAASFASRLADADSFFLPRPRLRGAAGESDRGLGNVPTMFQPNGNTTGGVMQFNGALPESVSAAERATFAQLLKDQQFYLQSGLGLVTAWMTRNYQQDPQQWANPANWQEPLSMLVAEFYTPTDITQYTFQQHIRGIEIASSFLGTLVGWASGIGLAETFTGFLSQLGDQIRAGVESKQTRMDTYHLSFGYQPVQDTAGGWQLVSTADYYFISFGQSEQKVYSSCASVEAFDFDFKYRKGSLLLNWATLSNDMNKDNRNAWDAVITGSTRDDVTKAKNFFGAAATPKT
jgi:hypothetical protein